MAFREFDASSYLKSPEEVEAYLNAVFEDGTAQEVALALGTVARSEGMSKISRDTGLNRVSLYTSLGENGNPSLDTIMKVLAALGYRLHVEREQKAATA